ncbi:MAG: hypothetical protein Q7R93_00530 [bacterium]|nr:hypothetical protein [bacterium]
MPTTKQRINITADAEMESLLRNAAKRDKMSVSSKAVELIRFALELEEDLYFGKIAEKRAKEKVTYVSHERAWKNFGK